MRIMTGYQFRRFISVQCGGIDVSALRINFEMTNHSDDNPPEGKVDIYNLSRKNHDRIEKRGLDIFVNAGYTSGAGIFRVFAGNVKRVLKTRVDHAFVTRIFVEDALASAANGSSNLSEDDPALSVRDIARKIIVDKMGLRVGSLHAIPETAVYPNFNASGNPIRALNTLADGTLSTTGQQIVIVRDGDTINFADGWNPIPEHDIVIKTPQNGLIGVPQLEDEGKATFQMLLEPKLRVQGQFEVQNSQYVPDSRYTITKVQHNGDNWTGKFTSTIECIDPNYATEGAPVGTTATGGETSDSGFASTTLSGRENQETTPQNIRGE